MWWELNSGFLEEHPVLLTSEPVVQLSLFFDIYIFKFVMESC